jgi:hypothetical protein
MLKNEVARLQSSNSSFAELYWQLTNGDASRASALLEQIRSGEHELDLSRSDVHEQSDDHPPSPEPAGGHQPSNTDTLESAGSSQESPADLSIDHTDAQLQTTVPSRPINTDNRLLSSSLLQKNAIQSLARRSEYDALLHHSLQSNRENIQEGFAVQRMCISEVFLCHESDAVESLFMELDAKDGTVISNAALCELCAVAAISGQYVRNLIASEVLDYWYGKFDVEITQFLKLETMLNLPRCGETAS